MQAAMYLIHYNGGHFLPPNFNSGVSLSAAQKGVRKRGQPVICSILFFTSDIRGVGLNNQHKKQCEYFIFRPCRFSSKAPFRAPPDLQTLSKTFHRAAPVIQRFIPILIYPCFTCYRYQYPLNSFSDGVRVG